jgi:predicted kinase
MANLLMILGSPASGKTTLARRLAVDLTLPTLSKDDVKEALFDLPGSGDREWSRLLSEASFGVLVHLARTQLTTGLSCILEGNWRAAHAAALRRVLTDCTAGVAQVFCRAEPQEIVRRFTLRARHPGHLDSLLAHAELEAAARQPPAFMDLGGPRFVYCSDSPDAYAQLLESLKNWHV